MFLTGPINFFLDIYSLLGIQYYLVVVFLVLLVYFLVLSVCVWLIVCTCRAWLPASEKDNRGVESCVRVDENWLIWVLWPNSGPLQNLLSALSY